MNQKKKFHRRLLLSAVSAGTFSLFLFTFYFAFGATNISSDSAEHWAWSDIISWINFYQSDTVTVTSQKIEGYASSSVGDISLDCATTRNGNICGTSNYYVVNDGNGNLSGWGWNDTIGWISFYCGNAGASSCATSNYRVYIDSGGNFQNYAWNDVVGWISFNCSDLAPPCGSSNYKVKTSWTATSTSGYLISSVIDTGVTDGVQINSVLWQGNQPTDTSVRFQLAVSNSSSGPWSYIGSDGSGNSYYVTDPGISKPVSYTHHNGGRYFRYRIELVSDLAQTASPRVDDVIINWSP